MVKWVFRASLCHRSISKSLEPNANDYYSYCVTTFTIVCIAKPEIVAVQTIVAVNKKQIDKTRIIT